MTTNIEYQVLGNTLRIRQTKDIVTDLNVFDAITSPNNSVMHGGIFVNFNTDLVNPAIKPTAPTNTKISFKETTTNSSANLLLNGYWAAASYMNGNYGQAGSVTINGTTFYGTKCANFEACFKNSDSSGYKSFATADVKLTVIKYIASSGEIIISEDTIESIVKNSTSTGATNATVNLQIPKSSNDLLLFVGIENIFETT